METKTSFLAHAKCLKAAYDICQPSSVLTDEQLSLSQRYMAVASYVRKTAGEKHDVESRNRAVERMVDEALRCNAVVSILDTEVLEQKFSPEFAEQIQEVKLPATHLEILVKMLRKRIREQKHANKVAAEKFEELLRKRLEAYHKQQAAFSDEEASETQSETVMAIINEATRLAMKLLQQLRQDKERLRALGLTFEEKAFYDILMHLRGKYHFAYGLDRRVGSITLNDKCKKLAQKIRELIDAQSSLTDWRNHQKTRADLNQKIFFCLRANGYPPKCNAKVFTQVMEQVEHFKTHAGE